MSLHLNRVPAFVSVLDSFPCRRTGSLHTENPNNGVTHGKAGLEQPKWGSKGLRTVNSVPSLAADAAPVATSQQQHLLHQQQQQKLARARSSSTASTAAAVEDVLMLPPGHPQAHPPAAHAHAPSAPVADLEENCAMSLTSSLTACSEVRWHCADNLPMLPALGLIEVPAVKQCCG